MGIERDAFLLFLNASMRTKGCGIKYAVLYGYGIDVGPVPGPGIRDNWMATKAENTFVTLTAYGGCL